MTYTEQQVKELLLLQRNICKDEYLKFYAGSEEDFAPECVVKAIAEAPEPVNFFSSKPPVSRSFNDGLVKDSGLEIRIRGVVKQMCLTKHSEFEGKQYDELYLSDLARLSYREWLRIRNIGKKAADRLKDYLTERGISIEH